MTGTIQSPRIEILWELASHGGKRKRSKLRRRLRMTLAELEPSCNTWKAGVKSGYPISKKRGQTN